MKPVEKPTQLRSGPELTAAQIAQACAGRVIRGEPGAVARGVSTDSRTLRAGEAFFALVGAQYDGHAFAASAAAGGAPVLVVQSLPGGWEPPQSVAVVRVADTAAALLALAARHRQQLSGIVAAVTGSFGKSTVKTMLGAILGSTGRCTVAPASFNNRVGVALALLSAACDDDFVVLEIGTNHRGEIDELARAARPALGVITAIGEAHLEGLGSLEGVKEAKAEMIPHLASDGILILNADDARCASLADWFTGKTYTFGTAPGADLRAKRIRWFGGGWAFSVGEVDVRLNMGGRYNVWNAAAALCAACALGVGIRQAARALLSLRLPPMRYEKRLIGGITFILDCYNSNPSAMRAALESFVAEPCPGRKVVICGDMLELGPDGPRLHRELGRDLAASGIDALVAVGPLGAQVVEGWNETAPVHKALHCASAEESCWPLWSLLRPGDVVLLKGSRGMRLETIVQKAAERLGGRKEAAA
jgi:UDP-N-acetylmuramoyl-tripeptide--D-alanyl-D-alanine ligase